MTTALSVLLSLSLIMGSNNTSPFVLNNEFIGDTTITGYGSWTKSYSNNVGVVTFSLGPINVQGNGYANIIHYEFNQSYSGTIVIQIYGSTAWNNAHFYGENCSLMGKNSSDYTYTIRIKNVTEFTATFVIPSPQANQTFSGSWANIKSYDIRHEDNGLDGIASGVHNIDVCLNNQTKGLSALYDNNEAQRSLLADILQALRGNATTGNIYATLEDINTVSTDIYNQITQIYAELIMNDVPMESTNAYLIFRNFMPLQTYSTDKFPYYNITSDIHSSYKPYLYKDRVYYISLRFYNPNNNSLWNYINIVNNSGINQTYSRSYHDYMANYSTVTLSFTPSETGYYSVDFSGYLIGKSVTPLYFGENTGLSSEMYTLTHIPNKFVEGIQGVIDAIKGLSLNVNNMTVNSNGITYDTNGTTVTNNVNNYNTYSTTVDNVEQQFGTDFENATQNYNMNDVTINDKILGTSGFMNNIATQLYNIDLVKYPVALMLLGIVVIGVLG